MIQEELYIVIGEERHRLDLNSPSGITLTFKSNLFSDLSKITASHTYTFKLPMTLNNRNVLESPEDIRAYATTSRRKYKCEFRQNGVDLFDNANLYIETTDKSCYNAVMTWGIVAGFDALKDGDISLREIGEGINEMGYYGPYFYPTPQDFNNHTLIVHPYRGMSIYDESNGKIWCMVNSEGKPVSNSSIPAVPIWYIINRINSIFGTAFNLGPRYGGSSCWDSTRHQYLSNGYNDIINRGVVPLVTVGLTDEQYEARTARLTNFKAYDYSVYLMGTFAIPMDAWDGLRLPKIITFDIRQPQTNTYFSVGGGGNVDPSIKWLFYKKDFDSTTKKNVAVEKFRLDGYLKVKFQGTTGETPKLILYHRVAERDTENDQKVNIVMKEEKTLEGRHAGYEYGTINGEQKLCSVFIFDFRKGYGMDALEVDNANNSSSTYPFFFNFNRTALEIQEGYVDITPFGKISDDTINKGWETDIFSNLPDIGCLEFMKSLFYVIGAFPGLSEEGEIIPLRYSQIQRNINNGNVLDWSYKLMSSVDDNPDKIDFKVSGFGQHNYYLLKNDDLDKPIPEEGEDVYEAGMMDIVCENNSLDREKTIIQIPWYGPYLKSGKYPPGKTNRDMKYEEFDPKEEKYSQCEAKPALGLIVAGAEGTYNPKYDSNGNLLSTEWKPNGTYRMFMEVLNPFRDLCESADYDYLQEIMFKPIVITEYLRLDEFDLRQIDYTKPIYINKYNSFFAIVSIQRDANGKCKCELIKLP